MSRIRDDSNALHISVLVLFGTFYLMNTQISIPYGPYLRWVVLFGFMLVCLIHSNFRISWEGIKNSPILGFIIIMIPSFLSFLTNNALLIRALSIHAVFLAFVALIQNASMKRISNLFVWFIHFISFTVIINAPLLFSRAFYLAGRFRGILKNANSCSCFAMMAMVCALYVLFCGEKIRMRKAYIIVVVISYMEVILSQSRMGFATSTLALVIVLIVFSNRTKKLRLLSSITVIVLLVLTAYIMINRLNISVLDRIQNEEAERTEWMYATELINEAPVFGHGYGITAYNQDNASNSIRWHFFSSYLELIVDTGYYGLGIYAIMMVIKIIKLIKAASIERMAFFFLLFIVCCLITGITESYMFSVGNPITVFFWFIVILAENYCHRLVLRKKINE